jgi:hypothetical protein
VRQIDRNLISRSIGIDPLYGRRMVGGRVMENETMLHMDVYNGLTAYEIFAMALDNDNLDELLVVLQDMITKIWTHEIEDDLFVNALTEVENRIAGLRDSISRTLAEQPQ